MRKGHIIVARFLALALLLPEDCVTQLSAASLNVVDAARLTGRRNLKGGL